MPNDLISICKNCYALLSSDCPLSYGLRAIECEKFQYDFAQMYKIKKEEKGKNKDYS